MKKLVCLALAALMALSLFACGSPTPAATTPSPSPTNSADATTPSPSPSPDAPITMTYAEVNPADSLMGQTATKFKESVESLSGGSITVNIQYSGVLGSENDVLDTMLGGGATVDISRISAFALNSYGATQNSLLSIPYTFTGREHFWKLANSELGQTFLNEPVEKGLGVKGLYYLEEGFRHFFFRSEITGLADLANKKIRVSTDPVMTGMVEGLGAYPTVVAFTELYTSLSSGVVDGAEQPIVNYQSNVFYEVAPYMILDAHTLGAAEVIILESTWNKLSANQQDAVMQAGKAASDFNANLSAQIEADCKTELLGKGVKFIDVPDLKPWQDACADVIASNTSSMQDLYNQILAMAP